MNPHYVTSWALWKEMGKYYGFDPYKNVKFKLSRGGGNSTDFEYIREIPEKEEDKK